MLNGVLVLLCIVAVVLATTAIGPASQSSGQTTRTATVKQGVVQSTVSGSGNVQSANELDLGFKTSGTVTHIYVKQGQQVTKGQLLATVDPESAEVTLEQAKATLQSAEANLAELEENEGESTSSQGATGTAASAASTSDISYTTNVSAGASTASSLPTSDSAQATEPTTSPTTSTSTTTPATTTPTTTTTTPSTSAPTANPKSTTSPTTTTTKTTTTPATTAPSSSSGSNSSTGTKESGTATPTSEDASKSTQSAATREANLASARASVKTDKLTVKSDEQAVEDTKLYAPRDGTIVSLSGEVGQTVSATGTTKSSSSSSSSDSSSSGSSGATGSKATTGATSSPSSSEGSTGGSTFMVLSDLEAMQLVVALSESEIGNVHVGQIATVTIEALNGRKIAAHVVSVNQVPTSTSGAVSYDATFQLDQGAAGLKVGMSATAEVVVKQAEGVNVPTSAIKAGSVTVLHNGKQVTQSVTTGLAGDSSTIVLSGLKAGETVVLPSVSTGTGSSSSLLGSRGSSRSGLSSSLGGSSFPGGGGGIPSGGGFPSGGPP